jgi:hypothetical protein
MGEFVHVELTPGVVTILPAWKLNAAYCAGLRVGAPQVSLAGLCALHELLVACESRLVSSDGSTVTQEAYDANRWYSHKGWSLRRGGSTRPRQQHASSTSFSTTCGFGA